MADLEMEILDFFRVVVLSDDAPRKIKEKCLDFLLKEESKKQVVNKKVYMIGSVPVCIKGHDRVFAYLKDDNRYKINAIKTLREISGVGLKEAKDAIEYWIKHGKQKVINPEFLK